METELIALYRSVVESDKLDFDQKKVMLDEIRKLKPASENRWNHRWVILAVAIVAISTPLAFVFKVHDQIPEVLAGKIGSGLASKHWPRENRVRASFKALVVVTPKHG